MALDRPEHINSYLTLMFTLLPGARTVLDLGFCDRTSHLFPFLPLTLPSLHSAFASLFFASLSFVPLILGTRQAM
jgi:hypothetical protein